MSARTLQEAIAELRGLAGALPEVASEAATRIATLVDDQFWTATDPYGAPYAPLRPATTRRGRAMPPALVARGDMRSDTIVYADGTSIVAQSSEPADYHQAGTSRMAQRLVLPTDARGLPPSWEAAIADECQRAIARRVPEAA